MRAAILLLLGACGFRGAGAVTSDDGSPVSQADAPGSDGDATRVDAASGDAQIVDASLVDAVAGPWLTGYAFRKLVHVNPASGTNLTDFPVAIIENADPDLALHALPNGGDIVVTASDAVTVLATELVSYGANGGVELWVKVKTLAPLTTLYLYYGGPVASGAPTATWSSKFAGVWHLSNAAGAHDSTTHAHDLAAVGAAGEPSASAGVAGGARNFDGVKNQLSIADPVDGSLDFGMGSFSYSAWVRETSALGQYNEPFWKGGTSMGEPGYCMLLGTGTWLSKVHDGSNFQNGAFGNEPAFTNKWVQLVAVIDRSMGKLLSYTNGVAQPPVSLGSLGSFSSPDSLNFGGPNFFHGAIDEVRIYNTNIDPSWVAAEYANLQTAGFVQIGIDQP